MNMVNQTPPTEGEEFVMDFLKEIGIKFEREKKIVGLEKDSKPYRIADFYLPKFGVYIEFFGLWNKNIKDEDYKLKKLVYRNNGIPCVYLYPENLGVISFSLDKRIQKTLIENGKYKELTKYRWFKIYKSIQDRIFLIALMILFLYLSLIPPTDYRMSAVVAIVAIYQLYKIYKIYYAVFVTNKYTLVHLLNR
jgi:hypothetical protein